MGAAALEQRRCGSQPHCEPTLVLVSLLPCRHAVLVDPPAWNEYSLQGSLSNSGSQKRVGCQSRGAQAEVWGER